jgi:pimeloyl-ACP methyl ester carboxylesterase
LIDLKHAVADPGGHVPFEFARAFRESHRARNIVLQRVALTLAEDDRVVAGQIRVPTLILWGDQDGVFDLYAQRRLQRLLQQSKLTVYPEVGHAPNREIPETVARDIILFSLP